MTRYPVDPFVQAVEASLDDVRPADVDDPVLRRAQAETFDHAMAERLGYRPIDVATEEATLPVEGHPEVRLRVYWPRPQRAEPGSELPILLYCYGGAFTLGGIDWPTWDATFRLRARDAEVIVVAVDYAHAPEVRFPAQPEQAWAALEWVREQAFALGGSASAIAVGGASSGGNIAAALALINRDRGGRALRLQLLECPALDLTMSHVEGAGVLRSVPGVILRRMARMLVRQYVGDDKAAAKHPYASPLLAASLADLPPAVVMTNELDSLRGDGEAYVRALTAAGVPATGMRWIAQTHTSGGLRGHVPTADVLHGVIVSVLRSLHEPEGTYSRGAQR